MSTNPASLYKLEAGKIYEGGPADIVLFDINKEWVVPNTFISKSRNTPFAGKTLYGQVIKTICNGQIVFENEN